MRHGWSRCLGSLGACCALLLLASPRAAGGSERRLAFTEQSPVLELGRSELSPRTTFRVGRERYFSRIEARLGLERGLGEGVSLSLWWDLYSQTQDLVTSPITDEVTRSSDSGLASVATQLKYQLTDPAADALGSALSLEAALGSERAGLRARAIADRSLGPLLLAANLSASYAAAFVRDGQSSKVDDALVLEPAIGAAYFLSPRLSLGLELRAELALSGEPATSALFGGPALAFGDRAFWVSLGVQPQLAALSEASPGTHLELAQHEKLTVRLQAGFAL